MSTLEVTTCAYIFCTLITYVCWLKKPYDIHHPVVLRKQLIAGSPQGARRDHNVSGGQEGRTTEVISEKQTEVRDSGLTEAGLVLPYRDPMDRTTVDPEDPAREAEIVRANPGHSLSMIFPGARFTPFNRSFYDPDMTWRGMCLSYILSRLLTTVRYRSCMYRQWYSRRMHGSHSRRALVDDPVRQHQRAVALACMLHSSSGASAVHRPRVPSREMVSADSTLLLYPFHRLNLRCHSCCYVQSHLNFILEPSCKCVY